MMTSGPGSQKWGRSHQLGAKFRYVQSITNSFCFLRFINSLGQMSVSTREQYEDIATGFD